MILAKERKDKIGLFSVDDVTKSVASFQDDPWFAPKCGYSIFMILLNFYLHDRTVARSGEETESLLQCFPLGDFLRAPAYPIDKVAPLMLGSETNESEAKTQNPTGNSWFQTSELSTESQLFAADTI